MVTAPYFPVIVPLLMVTTLARVFDPQPITHFHHYFQGIG